MVKGKPIKHRIKVTAHSFIHGIILTFLCFFLIQQPFIFPDEDILIKISGFFKNIVFNTEEKPDKDDFLFINTSYDNSLTDKLDLLTGFPMGNQVITNRKSLSEFFILIKKMDNPHRYIVCDVFFEAVSEDDPALQASLNNLKNYRIPYHFNNGQVEFPVVKGNLALADYKSLGDGFVKFQLIQYDSVKTLPLLMYEDIHNPQLYSSWFGNFINGKFLLNNFIVDLKIRDYDLKESGNYPLVNLGELLFLDSASLYPLLKDKIILIGNFYDHDQHETLFGSMSGTLLLANVYHALEIGDPFISFNLFLYLLLVFSCISFMVIWEKDPIEKFSNRLFGQKIKRKAVKEFPVYLIILGLISFSTFFFFNIHLQVFLINIYIGGMNWIYK